MTEEQIQQLAEKHGATMPGVAIFKEAQEGHRRNEIIVLAAAIREAVAITKSAPKEDGEKGGTK